MRRFMRLLCWWSGCDFVWPDWKRRWKTEDCECHRCGVNFYDHESYHQKCELHSRIRWWWRKQWHRFFGSKCEQCQQRFRGLNLFPYCSAKCHEKANEVPF